jgi:hypothetical protein
MLRYRTGIRTGVLLLIVIVHFNGQRAVAQDRWTNSTDKHHIDAAFVELQDDAVMLRNENGKEVSVPLAKLDDASRRLARTRAEELANREKDASPAPKILSLDQINERARGSIQPEENAVVAFWSAVGTEAIHPDVAVRRKYLDALGGDFVEPATPYLSWPAFVKAEGNGQNFGHDVSPLQATDHDAVEQWLARNEAPLAAAVAAINRPAYYSPMILEADDHPLWKAIIPVGIPARDVAYGLLARATSKQRHGDLGGAVDDAVAVVRLARHLNREPTLIGLAIARAIESVAIQSIAKITHDEQFTRDVAEQIAEQIKDLPPRVDFVDKLEFEKAIAANIVTRIAEGGPRELLDFTVAFVGQSSPESVAWSDTWAGRIGIAASPKQWDEASRPAWNAGAVEVASIYDEYARKLATELVADRGSRFNRISNEEPHSKLWSLFSSKNRSPEDTAKFRDLAQGRLPAGTTAQDVALWIHGVTCPDLSNAARLDADAAVREALIPTIIALGLHHSEQSQYPFFLEDLTPDYMPGEPKDLLFDQEFVFRSDVVGYALYSAGANGDDDDGEFSAKQNKDDLGFIDVGPKH